MVTLLALMELLTIISLCVFDSVLNGKHKSLKIVSMFIFYPFVLYLAAEFLTALPSLGVEWCYQSVALITVHTAFNFVMAMLQLVTIAKFADIEFSYDKQYLFARGALYFAFVFEVIALCAFVVCCTMIF